MIKPGWEWPGHRPGQYLRLGIEVDGRLHWRAYSLTSDPGASRRLHLDHAEARPRRHRHAVPVRAAAPGHDRAPGRRRRHLRAARAAARAAAVHQRRQRRHADREHAAQPRRRRRAMRDVVHVHSARYPHSAIFAEELRELAARHPGYRLHGAPQRRRRPRAARGARRASARTGASARRSCAGRPGCSRRSKRASRPTATPRGCTSSTSSPTR